MIGFVIYLALSLAIYFVLKQYRSEKFTAEKLEAMISTPSNKRDTTDDLCKYAILGNPKLSGDNYVKINFICSQEKRVVSTMSLSVLPDTKLETILKEYARIIGFNYQTLIDDNWHCLLEEEPVKSFSEVARPTNSLECYQYINLIEP